MLSQNSGSMASRMPTNQVEPCFSLVQPRSIVGRDNNNNITQSPRIILVIQYSGSLGQHALHFHHWQAHPAKLDPVNQALIKASNEPSLHASQNPSPATIEWTDKTDQGIGCYAAERSKTTKCSSPSSRMASLYNEDLNDAIFNVYYPDPGPHHPNQLDWVSEPCFESPIELC